MQLTQNKPVMPFLIEFFRRFFSTTVRSRTPASAEKALPLRFSGYSSLALRGSREEALEEAVEVGAGGLVHADEFDAHSAAWVGVANDGASAHFAFGRVDEQLNKSAGGGRVRCFNVEAAHAEGFRAIRAPFTRTLPGDENPFRQLFARVAARRWFFLGHCQGRIPPRPFDGGCATWKCKLSCPTPLPIVFKFSIELTAAERHDGVRSSKRPEHS